MRDEILWMNNHFFSFGLRDDDRPRQGSRQQMSAKEFARRKQANKASKNSRKRNRNKS